MKILDLLRMRWPKIVRWRPISDDSYRSKTSYIILKGKDSRYAVHRGCDEGAEWIKGYYKEWMELE